MAKFNYPNQANAQAQSATAADHIGECFLRGSTVWVKAHNF